MDGSRSSPLAAAVGLVVVTAGTVRRLPHVLGEARRVAHRRYDELALHGRDVLTGRAPGTTAPDGLRDGSAKGSPDGGPGPVVITPEESAAADAPPAPPRRPAARAARAAVGGRGRHRGAVRAVRAGPAARGRPGRGRPAAGRRRP